MAQIGVKSSKVPVVRTAVVKVAPAGVERRIKQFALTLIGRVWNLQFQNMESLLHNMPKFWKLEDRVVGSDLGDGKFHFKFQSEDDILDVLRNNPYHYDLWMVSLVRWELVVEDDYPSEITFWAQVRGIPLQYWEADSFKAVGDAVGKIKEVDEVAGYIRVALSGFQPLIFNTIIPYDTGYEANVNLIYDKLANHCKHCCRLSHLASNCPELCVQDEVGRVFQEEDNTMGRHQNGSTENQGWKFAQKRSVKRALDMTDFATKEPIGKQPEAGSSGVNQVQGPMGTRFISRDRRLPRRKGQRKVVWDHHARGNRT